MSRPPLNLSLYSSILPDSPEAILAADPGIRGITRPAVPELKGKWAYTRLLQNPPPDLGSF